MTTYDWGNRRELRDALARLTELVAENDRLKEFIRELEIALGRELN